MACTFFCFYFYFYRNSSSVLFTSVGWVGGCYTPSRAASPPVKWNIVQDYKASKIRTEVWITSTSNKNTHGSWNIQEKKIVVYRVVPPPNQKHILIHEFPELLLVREEGGSCPSARSIFHIFRHLITCGRSTCIADRERENHDRLRRTSWKFLLHLSWLVFPFSFFFLFDWPSAIDMLRLPHLQPEKEES
jgi:hypothetical protein